eukprot:6162866-Amphidinium_carterae.1
MAFVETESVGIGKRQNDAPPRPKHVPQHKKKQCSKTNEMEQMCIAKFVNSWNPTFSKYLLPGIPEIRGEPFHGLQRYY